MAALQRIRNHSVALLVIVGLAMVAFIVGDLITSSSSIVQSSRDKVVTINGKKVTYEEYEASRQRKQDFMKAFQGQELDAQASQQLNQQVYNEFITKNLIEAACEKLGLTVTTEELSSLVQGQNLSNVLLQMFGQQAPQIASYFVSLETNGGFDQAAMQNAFFNEANWNEIKDEIVLSRKVEKFTDLIAAAVTPNKLEAEDNFNGDNKEVSFAYVKQFTSSVADSLISVSKDDVKKYYDSTKRNYKLNASRVNVSYINVALRPSDLDYAEAEEDIKAVREDFATTTEIADLVNGNSNVPYIDAFVAVSGLDSELKDFVQANDVNAILEPHRVGSDTYMMARIMDKATAADSIEIAVAFAPSHEEADKLAAGMTAANDMTAALDTIDQQQKFIGWMQDPALFQSFGDELRNKIRNANVNQVIKHEISENLHVVCKVTGKTKPVALAKIAVYSTEVFPSTRTRGEEYGKLNRFLTTYKTVKQMQDSARANGFMMIPTTLYSTSYNVGGVADARKSVQFAFRNKKGSVSEIEETAGNNLLVVAVTGDVEDGYMNLLDTTFYQQLKMFNVAPLKKVEYLEKKFNEVADKTLAGYAASFPESAIDTAKFVNFNLNSVVGLGAEPKIFGAALNANPGEVITVAGRNAVVALQVLTNENKGLEFDAAERIETVKRSREYAQVTNAALQVLQDNAEIEDNRINFY